MSSTNESHSTFIAAIDQGTSSSRVILYNTAGEAVATHQEPITLIAPTAGRVEQDPVELIDSVKACLRGALEDAKKQGLTVSSSSIKAIGITNQRETTVVWDKKTGLPLYNTIGTQNRSLLVTPIPFPPLGFFTFIEPCKSGTNALILCPRFKYL